MPVAIKVENLSKAYQLGQLGTGTISRDIERWWAKFRGKEDPYLKIGTENDRTISGSKNEVVWSLKDINFEINQGDAVGIIGRNGAGKSTLLKLLSRVTAPTTGSIKAKGRIASLLEVGTGFHPELTGRENIYLNGAILGMRKKEIDRKLEQIIDFSGVERYIDTPVKRYSSGMYVRLAFAVAAHLDSEILIVDEVLAVGDAEFQKKCLGKMGEVSKGEGRTVLFVSHNIAAIQKLCTKGILLNKGQLLKAGQTNEILEKYISLAKTNINEKENRIGSREVFFQNVELYSDLGNSNFEFFMNQDLTIKLKIYFTKKIENAEIGINVKNIFDEIFTHVTTLDYDISIYGNEGESKEYIVKLININFTPGSYKIDIALVKGTEKYDIFENVFSFQLLQDLSVKRPNIFPSHVKTFVKSQWRSI